VVSQLLAFFILVFFDKAGELIFILFTQVVEFVVELIVCLFMQIVQTLELLDVSVLLFSVIAILNPLLLQLSLHPFKLLKHGFHLLHSLVELDLH